MRTTILIVMLAFAGLANAQSIFQVVPTPNGNHGVTNNALQAAAASSPTDIWAVGQTTIHYDGTSWTAFNAPMILGDNTSYLDGVVDFSPTNAWAVGLVGVTLGTTTQIIEHWNGTAWSVVPGPQFPANVEPELFGLTATSPTDIWAVGTAEVNNEFLYALFEHYDGTAWTAQLGHFYGFFQGVSADAPNDIWAVGYSGNATFAEHYNGTSWSPVSTPNVGTGPNALHGVVALTPNDVWAVGSSTATLKPPPGQYDVPTETLVEHFDGTAWSVVASPNIGPNSQYQSNRLLGITALTPNDIWAFGSFFAASGSENQMTLAMKWNGSTWTLAPTPDPMPGTTALDDILFGGVSTGPGDLWIVGSEDPFTTGRPVTVTFVIHSGQA